MLTLYWIASDGVKRIFASLYLAMIMSQILGTLLALSGLALVVCSSLYFTSQVFMPWTPLFLSLGFVFVASLTLVIRNYRTLTIETSNKVQMSSTLLATELEQILAQWLSPDPESQAEKIEDLQKVREKVANMEAMLEELAQAMENQKNQQTENPLRSIKINSGK